MKLRHLLFLLIPLIAGCASMRLMPGCVKVGPYGQICPLPPAALPPADATHLVSVTRNGDRREFIGRLEIDARALRLAGSSLFGTHLFTITYDGRKIVSRPPRSELHAELVVAMLEVALADPAALRPRLHGLTLKVGRSATGRTRDLYEMGRLVAHIDQSSGPLSDRSMVIRIVPADTVLSLKPLDGSK